jgi:hypothetical protein
MPRPTADLVIVDYGLTRSPRVGGHHRWSLPGWGPSGRRLASPHRADFSGARSCSSCGSRTSA